MSADLRRILLVAGLQASWRGRILIRETRGGTNGGYGPGQITGHISLRACCAPAVALQPWPLDPAIIFTLVFLKGVTVTNVGNSVQVDTNTGRPEPGPASISIEI